MFHSWNAAHCSLSTEPQPGVPPRTPEAFEQLHPDTERSATPADWRCALVLQLEASSCEMSESSAARVGWVSKSAATARHAARSGWELRASCGTTMPCREKVAVAPHLMPVVNASSVTSACRSPVAGLPSGTDCAQFSASWLRLDRRTRACPGSASAQQAKACRGLCEMPASPNIRLSAMSQSQ